MHAHGSMFRVCSYYDMRVVHCMSIAVQSMIWGRRAKADGLHDIQPVCCPACSVCCIASAENPAELEMKCARRQWNEGNKTDLDRVCQGVAEMQTASNIGRRQHNDEVFSVGVHAGLEEATIFPPGVPDSQQTHPPLWPLHAYGKQSNY